MEKKIKVYNKKKPGQLEAVGPDRMDSRWMDEQRERRAAARRLSERRPPLPLADDHSSPSPDAGGQPLALLHQV